MSDDINPSPELAAIARRWLGAFATGETEAVLNLFSTSAALSYVGSAKGEIWRDDDLRRGFAANIAQIPRFSFDVETIAAFERGALGWVDLHMTTHAPDLGKSAPFRTTMIFSLEKGVWRIVYVHNSNPVPNIEAMGYDARSFDELLNAVQGAAPAMEQTGSATVMFTDIADSSTLAEAIGDARWSRIVQDHIALISGLLRQHKGRLVKSLGDGTMSTFASAGAGLRAATAIQQAMAAATDEPRLQVRIGLHTGDVVEAADDFFGTVVNKAARIASAARPGETRVSDATRLMVGAAPGFAFCDPVRVTLKGLEGDHMIYRLEPDA